MTDHFGPDRGVGGQMEGSEGKLADDLPVFPVLLGALIRRERTNQQITLRAFAQSAGISATLLSRFERGEAEPSEGEAERIGAALGLRMDRRPFDVSTATFICRRPSWDTGDGSVLDVGREEGGRE